MLILKWLSSLLTCCDVLSILTTINRLANFYGPIKIIFPISNIKNFAFLVKTPTQKKRRILHRKIESPTLLGEGDVNQPA